MARWLGLALFPAMVGVAHAQAPGETDPDSDYTQPTYAQPPPVQPSYQPYQPAPVVVADPCGSCIDPMRSRFSVGVNVGGMGVTVDEDETGTETQFRTAELAIAYRLTRRVDLQLILSGGRQELEDGEDGDLAMGGGTLAARYHFRPDRKLNWYVMFGLGTTVIERADSTKEQRDAAYRPHAAFGIGAEYRWNHFALNAEIRGVGMGEREDAMDVPTTTPVPEPGGRDPLPPTNTTSDPRFGQSLSGGQFTLGASFYF
jgi:opacity protein-like surface antigen